MIIKFGAVLGLSSTMVVQIMGQPRIFYAMGKDGLLPPWAAKIHPRFRTPHVTTMITGAIVAVMAACTDLRTRAARQHRDAVRLRYRLDRRDRTRGVRGPTFPARSKYRSRRSYRCWPPERAFT